jgi:hypothetical protein
LTLTQGIFTQVQQNPREVVGAKEFSVEEFGKCMVWNVQETTCLDHIASGGHLIAACDRNDLENELSFYSEDIPLTNRG